MADRSPRTSSEKIVLVRMKNLWSKNCFLRQQEMGRYAVTYRTTVGNRRRRVTPPTHVFWKKPGETCSSFLPVRFRNLASFGVILQISD